MEEIDLKELLILFWNKKIKIILIMIFFIIIGAIYTTKFITPMYTSSTTLVLATSENISNQTSNSITTTDITLNSKLISTYSELVKSKSLVGEVISNLGINIEEEALRKNISVSLVKDTDLIKISVTNINAENATKIANEIAEVFSKKVSEIYNISNVHIVDSAKTDYKPSNINHLKDIILSAGIGFVIAVMYVLLSNMLDSTIKSAEEIEKNYKIPVLATIPKHNFGTEKGGKKK